MADPFSRYMQLIGMAFKAKFLFINEKLLPKNIFTEIKKNLSSYH